ncbi:DUF927 domain-containing protein [Clostridium formicaceticum]|uniref:DNA primase n=1 Tax=Clostridium formicaceticum TaxID=1497 RepID=A0AAC9RL38_9CLOT|nr:DUF927 domain-containing protein [Clostridium formicaceticum]AOY74710.1 hypothetical protein BJL90_01315 [Clostridium formicaceticum]ARE89089.1 DNA primase [Clostridium formicaceticum]
MNLEGRIDYLKFYQKHIQKGKISGENLVGLCPFHEDTKPSFGANIKTGVYNCLACGEKGNAITFLAKLYRIDNKEAYRLLLQEEGLYEENHQGRKDANNHRNRFINTTDNKESNHSTRKPSDSEGSKHNNQKNNIQDTKTPEYMTTKATTKKEVPKYIVEDYCKEKRLPEDFIRSLGIRDGKTGITIPYKDEAGKILSNRQRYHRDSPTRFSWARGSKINLYGLWQIEKIKSIGRVILVEGESDCHTLWHHGIEEILGVPGATTFHGDWVEMLEGLDVYIHHEGDMGGDTFFNKISKTLKERNFKARIYKIQCSSLGVKDPSDLHIKDPNTFKENWQRVMAEAEEIFLINLQEEEENLIPNAPVKLRQPTGWRITEGGVEMINAKTRLPYLVCRTPILISRRIKALGMEEEKVEIAFFRDKKWHFVREQRSTIFQARTIIKLADVGVTVTSENAKFLVRFLENLEAENFDIIETLQSVNQLGWHGENFLPGREGELVLDMEHGERRWVEAYSKRGELKDWIKMMKPLRQNTIFRFILASSFAAPLLKLLNHRIFFVHNWGDSRGGKTAALKAALSVWGNPEELMTSFNATNVGLERLASFFNDLPLGIDERQVAGGKQEYIETLVYMLSMGYSKVRGTKTGGLENQKSWRSIVLTTGEEPLTTMGSQTGVHTRALEIHGSPFEREEEARSMHNFITMNYGVTGPFFIEKLMEDMKPHELQDRHKEIQETLMGINENHKKIGSHVSSVAVVILADELMNKWLFLEKENISIAMGNEILSNLEDMMHTDIVERAYEFIQGWLISNIEQFRGNPRRESYGVMEDNRFYVFPQILQEALDKQGYSYKKIIQGLGDRGYIDITYEKSGKKRQTVVKKIEGKACRMVSFDLSGIEDLEETPPFKAVTL